MSIKKAITILNIVFIYLNFSNLTYAQCGYQKRELRGAWIATVANIDWPSSNNLSADKQKEELINILDKLKEAGINSVFFQIRTECDALYNSSIEPWSYWLTGRQGKAPVPFYDPLEFIIEEAHKRAMEVHAWFNPYRAALKSKNYVPASNHITITHSDWILQFGDLKILNPGIPEVREYIVSIVKDVAERYDIDGVHFDDYFYPYTQIKDEDGKAFKEFKGDYLDINDWRRNNINAMIKEVSQMLYLINPRIKFGVSPFGIVENKYAGTSGFESYKTLYCDPLNWINNKTIDYINPQLYWEIGHHAAGYEKLLPWWASVKNGRHLYIGHFSSRISAEDYKGNKAEIGNQIRLNKKQNGVEGDIFFSAKSITKNYSGIADSMKQSWYKFISIPQTMKWKDSIPPLAPKKLHAFSSNNGVQLKWEMPDKAEDGEYPSYYIIYRFVYGDTINLNDATKIIRIISASSNEYFDNSKLVENKKLIYVVTSLDRLWNESKCNTIEVERNR